MNPSPKTVLPFCGECGGAHEPSGARSDCILFWRNRALAFGTCEDHKISAQEFALREEICLWCEREEAEKQARVAANWRETAERHHRNEEYYRGLLIRIANNLGNSVFIRDDGTVSESPLVDKLPELIEAGIADFNAMARRLAQLEHELNLPVTP